MSSPTYTPPTSPARDVSNPHAYAVKTTSSGLLTRSNSANTRPGLTSHSYAPVCPPSPTPLGTPKSHRPRRSLSHIQPASSHLPSFPPPASPARRLDFTGRHHSYAGPSHSEAFPSFSGTLEMPLNKQRKSVRDPDDRNAPVEYWSSTRLSSWFVNLDCLANFGISMDTANDIAGFVKENGISGSNLVNITEAGLLSLHADHAWIPTIFSASRHLATTTHAIPEEMEMLRNDPFVMQRGSPAHSERLPGSTRVRRIAASFEESRPRVKLIYI
ncbi:hypothetical protein CALVIDRAFT_602466 [Calocera viscosa TUFC12733]|uniref:Uncharacterized protein n=1 Tax=Calocera viscosa (strain TUFC12733) TaxID=1330018 RepID=A0A167H1W5_CALVF|nr:hypothetical protein CALVIDRAFT_602466 [Calocera viscosa TUFC12733]